VLATSYFASWDQSRPYTLQMARANRACFPLFRALKFIARLLLAGRRRCKIHGDRNRLPPGWSAWVVGPPSPSSRHRLQGYTLGNICQRNSIIC